MECTGEYNISFSGEFADKTLEEEFFHSYMKNHSRFIGTFALAFGIIYSLFAIADYFDINNPHSLMIILITRTLFLIVSISLYFGVKKSKNPINLAYLISAYEIWAVSSFMVIIYQYGTIGFIAFFSVMTITLAIYIIPNRLIHAQMISIFFNLSFFILFASHIEGIERYMLLKIVGYDLIFIILGNIEAYLTHYFRRRQFADRRELIRLSITDSLTGIYNRVKFNQELNRWVDYSNRYGNSLSLVIFDIDDFKKVNDNFGHLIGDSVLKKVTSVIQGSIRSTDIFARWGGEEFIILLPNTGIYQAMELTERMRVCIHKSNYERIKSVTCSFGLAALRKNENADSILERADKLLYDAKRKGKNTVSCEVGRIQEQKEQLDISNLIS